MQAEPQKIINSMLESKNERNIAKKLFGKNFCSSNTNLHNNTENIKSRAPYKAQCSIYCKKRKESNSKHSSQNWLQSYKSEKLQRNTKKFESSVLNLKKRDALRKNGEEHCSDTSRNWQLNE